MRKKINPTDVIEIVTNFQKRILDNKPTSDLMYQEVRMMKFKVKPVIGDISFLNLKNNSFIEILWSLGKIDEFFQNHNENLSEDEREIFYRLLDEMYEKYQEELNTVDLKKESFSQSSSSSSGFEMEIFKDRNPKAN
jgi:NCAIR mutase (PurE)-related protein